MDYQALADLLFPDVTATPEELEARFPQRNLPEGAVVTRMAPSPTGFVHLGNLVQGMISERMAHRSNGVLFLRVEDTDAKREVPGAVEVLIESLKHYNIHFDEGATIDGDNGSYGPYRQRQRADIYHVYAKKLVSEGKAYPCFCTEEELTAMREKQEANKETTGYYGPYAIWRDRSMEEIQAQLAAGNPWVLRFRSTGSIEHQFKFDDLVKGKLTITENNVDHVLLKSDGLPTYNFANVVDDHLMGITHVVRGSEYLSSAPKYNLLYEAFGWEIPTYVHCSPVMRDAQHKMSKRHGDPSYEDLIREGYLTEAVLNYVALLGWSPKGENAEREFYTLSELAEIFDISGISKSPAVFDINKLRWMNAEYMKKLSPEAFFAKAEPVLKTVITNPAIDLKAVAALVQPRCEILSDLPERVDFIDRLPEYSTELYVHKKSKTTLENSLSSLREILPVLESLEVWTNEGLYEALVALAAKLELKNSVVLWPLRVAVSGKASTPGGATELCALLGKEESIARVKAGIALLEKS